MGDSRSAAYDALVGSYYSSFLYQKNKNIVAEYNALLDKAGQLEVGNWTLDELKFLFNLKRGDASYDGYIPTVTIIERLKGILRDH